MSDVNTIVLEGVVDISRAESLYGEFEKSIGNGGNITIKSKGLDRIDTSIIQVILAAKQSVEEHHSEMIWQPPSEAMKNTTRLLGVDEILGLQ